MSTMICVVDWDALGTWVTGLAAASIAVLVYRAGINAERGRAEVERRRMIAYRLACRLELETVQGMAKACRTTIADSLGFEEYHLRYGPLRTFAEMRSFSPPKWVTTSPMLGHLSEEVGSALVTAFAKASELERLRVQVRTLLRTCDDAALEGPTKALARGSLPLLDELVATAEEALSHVR